MPSRRAKLSEYHHAAFCIMDMDNVTERLRKVRSLNCDPSRFGLDGYPVKNSPFKKFKIVTQSRFGL